MLVIWLVPIVYCLKIDETKIVTKLAFGSCANQFGNKNPSLFYSISKWKPDLFIWLGDIIYADVFWFIPWRFSVNNLISWRNQYLDFKNSPEYSSIVNVSMVTGVWDDHDYGINDGNKHFHLKEESKKLLLEFLDDGSVRNHPGVYHSFNFKNLKVILLDIRWFRDLKNDTEGDSLGEEQWKWLESELNTNTLIKVIGNGLQINTHDRQGPAEKWHKNSRIRLLKLIENIPGVILLSGDVHYGEILKLPCQNHIFYEVTSSGLTHSIYGTIGSLAFFVINYLSPFTWNIGQKYIDKNYGTLEFNWEEGWVEISIRNSDGLSVNSHKVHVSEFYNKNTPPNLCFKDAATLKNQHIYSSLLIFVLPFLLYAIIFIIFLRKYSNSY